MNRHEPSPKVAQLNIKSAEARRLASELAELTGENMTEAVTVALRDRLTRERRARRAPGEGVERLLALGREFSKYRNDDTRTADEILGYDENGLPT